MRNPDFCFKNNALMDGLAQLFTIAAHKKSRFQHVFKASKEKPKTPETGVERPKGTDVVQAGIPAETEMVRRDFRPGMRKEEAARMIRAAVGTSG